MNKIPTDWRDPARSTNKRTKFTTVKTILTSKRKHCANPDKAKPPSDPKKEGHHQQIDMKSESRSSTERTTNMKRDCGSYSGFKETRSPSEADFEESTYYSSTRPSFSRTRWSSISAQQRRKERMIRISNTRSWNLNQWFEALSDASDRVAL